jgi:hypothetical protein
VSAGRGEDGAEGRIRFAPFANRGGADREDDGQAKWREDDGQAKPKVTWFLVDLDLGKLITEQSSLAL